MEGLNNIVEISETLLHEIVSGPFSSVIMFMFPVWSILFVTRFIRRLLLDPSSDYGTISSTPSSFVEQVYHEELSQEDIEVIEAELLTLEPEPESTHREEYAAALGPVPKPVHIKMVKCKHCLAPKPEGGNCEYCGLG